MPENQTHNPDVASAERPHSPQNPENNVSPQDKVAPLQSADLVDCLTEVKYYSQDRPGWDFATDYLSRRLSAPRYAEQAPSAALDQIAESLQGLNTGLTTENRQAALEVIDYFRTQSPRQLQEQAEYVRQENRPLTTEELDDWLILQGQAETVAPEYEEALNHVRNRLLETGEQDPNINPQATARQWLNELEQNSDRTLSDQERAQRISILQSITGISPFVARGDVHQRAIAIELSESQARLDAARSQVETAAPSARLTDAELDAARRVVAGTSVKTAPAATHAPAAAAPDSADSADKIAAAREAISRINIKHEPAPPHPSRPDAPPPAAEAEPSPPALKVADYDPAAYSHVRGAEGAGAKMLAAERYVNDLIAKYHFQPPGPKQQAEERKRPGRPYEGDLETRANQILQAAILPEETKQLNEITRDITPLAGEGYTLALNVHDIVNALERNSSIRLDDPDRTADLLQRLKFPPEAIDRIVNDYRKILRQSPEAQISINFQRDPDDPTGRRLHHEPMVGFTSNIRR